MLYCCSFHYDGKTTTSRGPSKDRPIHVSARKQAKCKWWYAKRFLHPSVRRGALRLRLPVGVGRGRGRHLSFFDADEYVRIVRSHAGENVLHLLVRWAARRRGAAQEHRRRARELLRPAPPALQRLRRGHGPACGTW
jgi:hypothetical protein